MSASAVETQPCRSIWPAVTADERRQLGCAYTQRCWTGLPGNDYPDSELGEWYTELDLICLVGKLRGHAEREIVEGLESVRICDWRGLRAAAAPLLVCRAARPGESLIPAVSPEGEDK